MRCLSQCLSQTQSSRELRLPLQLFLRARTRSVAGSHKRKLVKLFVGFFFSFLPRVVTPITRTPRP